MKVVHIASGDLWAGAEKQLLSLTCALNALPDTEVETVILNPGTLANRLIESGIPTVVLDEGRLGSYQLLRQLIGFLRRARPDLLHTHRIKENMLGAIAGAVVGIPSLRTQHGAQEHSTSWHDLRRQLLAAGNYLTGRLLQRRIVAVSTLLANELRGSYGAARVSTIANGIEPGEAPVARSITGEIWAIGVVGRLVPVKRVDLFLQIAERLAANYPRQSFRFEVIGDGPLRSDLESQARKLGGKVEIAFRGHVDDAEGAIAALDLLVLCSDHEGLPMVALEAMKAGTVVITHAIGGLPELLDEGRCGVIADSQKVDAFVNAIGALLDRPQQAMELATCARERLEKHYSSLAMAQQYRALYAEVLRS